MLPLGQVPAKLSFLAALEKREAEWEIEVPRMILEKPPGGYGS